MSKWRGMATRAKVFMADGNEYEVSYGMPEIVAWERANKGKPYFTPDGAVYFERQAWAIWSASKKRGFTDADFNSWLGQLVEVEVEQKVEGEEDDPTSGNTPESSQH